MNLRTLFAVALLPATAHAFSTGVTGYSGKTAGQTCNNCHSGGKPPKTVTLSGPASLAAGETQVYTLQIVADVVSSASMPADLPYSGFDVATSDGTIGQVSQVNQTRVLDNELSHTDKFPRANIVQVMFSLKAPMTAGPVTLFASGLSANGDGTPGGDSSAQATLSLTVTPPAAPPPDLAQTPPDLGDADLAGADLAPPPADLAAPPDLSSAAVDLAVVDAISSATKPAAPVIKPDLGPPHDEARWGCDCRMGGRAPFPVGGAWPAVALVALLALRRRRS
jgi:MYXO-CTERM domain-containing protein